MWAPIGMYSFPFFWNYTREKRKLLIEHSLLMMSYVFCYEIMQEIKVPIFWLKSMSKLNLGASEKSVEKTNILVFWKQLRVVRHNVVCLDNRTLSWYTALRESITCLVWRLSLKSLSQKETPSFTSKASNPIKGARRKKFPISTKKIHKSLKVVRHERSKLPEKKSKRSNFYYYNLKDVHNLYVKM